VALSRLTRNAGAELRITIFNYMKLSLVFLIISIAVAVVIAGIWINHKSSLSKLASQELQNASKQLVRPSPPPTSPGLLAMNEWQELHRVREATLANSPELKAEYKSLLAQMDEQQKKLDVAMIHADPKVAPIIAKLEAMRKHNSVPSGTVSSR
jgi:FtsZ-interacting cell division protein ZipA